MIVIHEQVGNFSHILETFESLEDRVREDIMNNEDVDNPQELENLRELYFSYYSIEEVN